MEPGTGHIDSESDAMPRVSGDIAVVNAADADAVAGIYVIFAVIAAGDNGIILEVDGEQLEFGYAELGPGRVQVEFGRPAAGPGGQDAARAGAATGPRTGGRTDGH